MRKRILRQKNGGKNIRPKLLTEGNEGNKALNAGEQEQTEITEVWLLRLLLLSPHLCYLRVLLFISPSVFIRVIRG